MRRIAFNRTALAGLFLLIAGFGCNSRPGVQRERPAAGTPSASAVSHFELAPPPIVAQGVKPAVAQPQALESSASGFIRIDGPALLDQIRTTHAKATLVNVWASWCGSCKHELPMLQKVTKELAAQGLELLLVSVDEPEQEQKGAQLLGELGFDELGFVAQRPLGPFKKAMNPAWPGMIPATFLFDSDANLRYYWGGEAFESELRPVVEGFLRGERIDGEANYKVAPE